MNTYEKLHQEAYDDGVIVREVVLKSNSDGLYCNGKIAINKARLSTTNEKICVLPEELGHHHTSYGNILDLSNVNNSKQEYKARLYAYNKLVGLNGLINAYKAGCRSKHDMAEYLDVTEEFLDEVLECYTRKFGVSTEVDNYVIAFIPNLIVMELV